MDKSLLAKTAAAMVARGKGVLAADESAGTCETRFKTINTPCTEENRRAYRGLLFTTPGVEQFLYWAKGGVGPEPSITLHHLVIHRGPGGSVYVADKQLYASRYADAGLMVLWLAAPRDGGGYYLLAGLRSRSRELTGFAARMLRSQVEEESRAYTRIYLDWIRKSLVKAP